MPRPRLGLRVFIGGYLFFTRLGCRGLPGFKGLFFRLYHRMKHKHGVMRVTTNEGHRLYIDLQDDIIATALIEYGAWELTLTELIKKLVKPGMTVLDVGAHVGYYATLLSELVGERGRVIAFEPEKQNFALLQVNAGTLPNCMLVNKGVSNNAGSVELYLADGNLGAHSMHVHTERSETIETVVLDDFLDGRVDFIKMDIEGNEPLALEGMKKILAQPQVQMVFEYVPGYVANPEKMFNDLAAHGFTFFVVSHETGALTPIATAPVSEVPTVFNIFCTKETTTLENSRRAVSKIRVQKERYTVPR